MRAFATALVMIILTSSVYAAEYHVSTSGLDGNPGSLSKPFKTVSAAAEIAQPGDTITVHEGIYRERVNPPRGGASDRKLIVYQAAQGEQVVIKGSVLIEHLWEFPDIPSSEGVRTDEWKYLRYIDDPSIEELYDLREDPGEMNNLANDTDHQETMADLRARLEQLAMRYSASRNTASEAH